VARHRDGNIHVAITGAGNTGVFRWTEAEDALQARFEPDAVKGLLPDENDIMGDMHAPADYRAHLVGVVTRRAVENLGGTLIE
ncbi:MAG TPA: carbon monoxide dehydrogenase, partial [Phyllobacterium sp.]|nr:carbon monoxide dehydrogenase [Phyllobacterium sp.]